MTMQPVKRKYPRVSLYLEGAVLSVVGVLVLVLGYAQFRGDFTPKTPLTMLASRAGLLMDPGSKVTYNGVQIGRVASISEIQRDGKPAAKLLLDIDPTYIKLIPVNVDANIKSNTVFGNKRVSFTSPKNPTPQRISPHDVIDARSVTTEVNTLFETITSIAEKVDPVKLNLTLAATAEALAGLGDKFGQSIVNTNAILDDVNPQMPEIRHDLQRFADLADVYTDASPDFWKFVDNAVTTAHTFNQQQQDVDAALLASVGAGNTVGDVIERARPYFDRGLADLVTSAKTFDTYSPEFVCTIRTFHDVYPALNAIYGANGYSLRLHSVLLGAPNPWVYPDNLPRVNAHGGPQGAPGCWAPITRDLWPTPQLVVDTGETIAPYNHFALGQPLVTEYVWGRQIGEYTINP